MLVEEKRIKVKQVNQAKIKRSSKRRLRRSKRWRLNMENLIKQFMQQKGKINGG